MCSERIPDLKEPDPDLQTEFLNLRISYHSKFSHDYLGIAESYLTLFAIRPDPEILTRSIVNAVMAPHSPKQAAFCVKIQGMKELTLMPEARDLLAVFLELDLVPWPDFEPRFANLIPELEEDRKVMRQRVIEHGLRVFAKFYTAISLERLAELEQISVNELEERIIDLVFAEGFYAKIDRPQGLIVFARKQKPAEVVDEFSGTVVKLCRLVDQAHSLIEKEKQRIHRPRLA
jgi:hypothetical protein